MITQQTSPATDPTFGDRLEKLVADDLDSYRRYARVAELGRNILREAFFHAPRTLTELFGVSYFSSGSMSSGWVPTSIHTTFSALGDMEDMDRKAKALGTIDKVVTMLKNAGWTITDPPTPQTSSWPDRIIITVRASKKLSLPMPAMAGVFNRLRRPDKVDKTVSLNITFDQIGDTPNCRLVTRTRTVEAVDEHNEEYSAVECKGVTDA